MNRGSHAGKHIATETERPPSINGIQGGSPVTTVRARAILIDLCGTIVDDTLWSRWLFRLVSRMGLQSHYELFWHVWQQDYQSAVNLGHRDYWDALRAFLASSGLTRGQIDEVCHAALARRRHLDETVRPFPGVKGTLAKLRLRNWTLGVIANSARSTVEIRQRLEQMGIAELFQWVAASRDLSRPGDGTCRYTRAAAVWQLPPHEILFVSTSPFEREAACRAGLATIAMPRTSAGREEMAIEHLDELLALLADEQAWSRAG